MSKGSAKSKRAGFILLFCLLLFNFSFSFAQDFGLILDQKAGFRAGDKCGPSTGNDGGGEIDITGWI